MNELIEYARVFLGTKVGQALLSFLRVGAAAVVASWMSAGTPLAPSADQLASWLQLGLEAGVALVVANYLGPWEKRYGRQTRQ